MKEQDKKKLNAKHLEDLATLARSKEFKSLEEVMGNSEYNLMVKASYLNNPDPVQLAVEHSFIKGEINAIKRIIREVKQAAVDLEKQEEKKK